MLLPTQIAEGTLSEKWFERQRKNLTFNTDSQPVP
jgi:hypothetical protein